MKPVRPHFSSQKLEKIAKFNQTLSEILTLSEPFENDALLFDFMRDLPKVVNHYKGIFIRFNEPSSDMYFSDGRMRFAFSATPSNLSESLGRMEIIDAILINIANINGWTYERDLIENKIKDEQLTVTFFKPS